MKLMRRTAGYTKWDHKIYEDILNEHKIKPAVDYIQNYQIMWNEHLNRMNTGRIPKQISRY